MPRSKRKRLAKAREAEAREEEERARVDAPIWGYWNPGFRDDGSLIRQRRSLSGYPWNYRAAPSR